MIKYRDQTLHIFSFNTIIRHNSGIHFNFPVFKEIHSKLKQKKKKKVIKVQLLKFRIKKKNRGFFLFFFSYKLN